MFLETRETIAEGFINKDDQYGHLQEHFLVGGFIGLDMLDIGPLYRYCQGFDTL